MIYAISEYPFLEVDIQAAVAGILVQSYLLLYILLRHPMKILLQFQQVHLQMIWCYVKKVIEAWRKQFLTHHLTQQQWEIWRLNLKVAWQNLSIHSRVWMILRKRDLQPCWVEGSRWWSITLLLSYQFQYWYLIGCCISLCSCLYIFFVVYL